MCTDCNPTAPIVTAPVPKNKCGDCGGPPCKEGIFNSDCISFTGLDLDCIGIRQNDRLTEILQKIDEKICNLSPINLEFGDTFCIGPIQTFGEFATKISDGFCRLKSGFDIFKSSVYINDLQNILNRINLIDKPSISSCSFIGIDLADSIKQILSRQSTAICSLNDRLKLQDLLLPKCFNGTKPDSIETGLSILANKICQLESLSGGSIPAYTFDNTGCLNGGPNDDTEVTINKIKSRLCQTPVFNPGNINWECVPPAVSLDVTISNINNAIATVRKNSIVAFNTDDFQAKAVDPTNPCAGKILQLNTVLQDRKVALNANDSPGHLEEKITAGAGISLENISGKIKITNTAQINNGQIYKVKSDESDDIPDYLINKIIGKSNQQANVVITKDGKKVQVGVNINIDAVIDAILEMIENDNEIKLKFCNALTKCPSPCAPPTNVEAIAMAV